MENQSVLKNHILELEQRFLEAKTRTTPEEIDKLLLTTFLNLAAQGMFGTKGILLVEEGLV